MTTKFADLGGGLRSSSAEKSKDWVFVEGFGVVDISLEVGVAVDEATSMEATRLIKVLGLLSICFAVEGLSRVLVGCLDPVVLR